MSNCLSRQLFGLLDGKFFGDIEWLNLDQKLPMDMPNLCHSCISSDWSAYILLKLVGTGLWPSLGF
jgi:hypothetical protein